MGAATAQEDYFLAAVTTLACVWVVLSWTRGPRAEAWLTGFLVFGYVIGNRGFAQISPSGSLPLFVGELGLAAILTLTVMRGASARQLPFHADALNWLLLLWVVIGSARMLQDLRTFGLVAGRDFAMVYYTLYFFTAQAMAHHTGSRQLLHTAFVVTFAVLPLTGLAVEAFPDFFLQNLLVRGVPLIHYKGDLLATFLFTGFILLVPLGEFRWSKTWWRWLLGVAGLAFGLTTLSRASLVALAVAVGWLALSGRWRPLQVIACVAALGLIGITVGSLLQEKDFTETRVYAVYESVVSIGDVSGTAYYRSTQADNKGDNNRFRLVWWRNVAQETLRNAPIFGLGFGADLAGNFLQEYYPDSGEDFSARSPHNLFVTTLGRMGLVGTAVLGAIYWIQGRRTLRVARLARGAPERDSAIAMHAACWVIMISSCFGVVLEGPMGAIPFWTLLGLAHFESNRDGEDIASAPARAPGLTATAVST